MSLDISRTSGAVARPSVASDLSGPEWDEAIARAQARLSPDNPQPAPNNSVQPVVSDVSPNSVKPGKQYAQAAMGLCLAGPAGCALGTGITLGQALLAVSAGAAVVGTGAVILNHKKHSDSGRPQGDGARPSDTAGTPPSGPDDQNAVPAAGNLKEASKSDLSKAARGDGYTRVEDWKRRELGLDSKDQILIDRNGNLYSVPRQGEGPPQPLNVRVPR
jgi:hypothetical protein